MAVAQHALYYLAAFATVHFVLTDTRSLSATDT